MRAFGKDFGKKPNLKHQIDVLNLVFLYDEENGGAMQDRTADLLRARQALSQLSYSPIVIQWYGPFKI